MSSASALQPRFGVPHRRRRIAVDRSEVALAVDQRVAHVEVLRQPDERVVDRRVAVGMEVAHHLADDLRALAVAARRRQPHRLHAVEHAAVRRLEAVARVGQRSSNDYAHGVIHVRPLHFVFDVDRVLVRRIGLSWFGLECWSRAARAVLEPASRLHVEVLDVERVVFDELAARLDLIAHQRREHQVGFGVIFGAHLQQRPDRADPSSSPRADRDSSRRGPCSG